MAATGVVVSAYHPANDTVPNLRLESMGKHVPTTFKAPAPPVR